MKQSNRELMERAIGIIEGVSFCVSEKVQDALALAVDMLEKVLNDEEKEEEAKK
jgi:hypothetical protein